MGCGENLLISSLILLDFFQKISGFLPEMLKCLAKWVVPQIYTATISITMMTLILQIKSVALCPPPKNCRLTHTDIVHRRKVFCLDYGTAQTQKCSYVRTIPHIANPADSSSIFTFPSVRCL